MKPIRPNGSPPASRLQLTANSLQRKSVAGSVPTITSASVKKPTPVAPPVYRPQPLPKVLQRKTATSQRAFPQQHIPTPARPGVPGQVVQPLILYFSQLADGANLKQQHSHNVVISSSKILAEKLIAKGRKDESAIMDAAAMPAEYLKNLPVAEKLYIIGHGNGHEVGKKNPADMAAFLITHGGLRNTRAISVVSCLSYYKARGADGQIIENETYVHKLAAEMKSLIEHAPASAALTGKAIKGRTGFAFFTNKKRIRSRGRTPQEIEEHIAARRGLGDDYDRTRAGGVSDAEAFERYKTAVKALTSQLPHHDYADTAKHSGRVTIPA